MNDEIYAFEKNETSVLQKLHMERKLSEVNR